jgi:hypothetical protein
MSRSSVLARAQAMAEAAMTDTCVIRRLGAVVTDPDTGERTPTTTTIYTGKCRVQQHQAIAGQHEAGQDYQLLLRLEVQLPIAVTGLQVADEITITAVGAGHDPDLPGRVFKIHDLAHKSEASCRRPQCTEKTGS